MSSAAAHQQSLVSSNKPKGVITMKIEKFSEFANEKNLTSETVYIRGLAWTMNCSTKRIHHYGRGFPSWTSEFKYSINCQTTKPTLENWNCEAHMILKIKAIKRRNRDYIEEKTHNFGSKKGSCDFSPYMEFKCLRNPKNGWYNLWADSITLSVEIEAHAPIGLGLDCRIHEQMGTLFEDMGGQFSDCTLVAADGKEFKIYKGILACRSPVFAAMFRHDLAETRNNVVQITDIESEALGHLLRYIYTGVEPIDFGKIAGELLAAADKYEFERLKISCEHELTNSLAIENACEILSLAKIHSVDHLEKKATKFIQEHIKEVMATEGWNLLRNENRALADQLVKEKMTRKRKQQSPL